mmetsp:Transcript_69970/g.164661  ORF Transcript_69970/g.164661 Transcript_69970/m.164661 type:complete len:208 (+) Transcript_69970:239-862(+)
MPSESAVAMRSPSLGENARDLMMGLLCSVSVTNFCVDHRQMVRVWRVHRATTSGSTGDNRASSQACRIRCTTRSDDADHRQSVTASAVQTMKRSGSWGESSNLRKSSRTSCACCPDSLTTNDSRLCNLQLHSTNEGQVWEPVATPIRSALSGETATASTCSARPFRVIISWSPRLRPGTPSSTNWRSQPPSGRWDCRKLMVGSVGHR